MSGSADAAQLAAADARVSAWVGASAGTGKTKVLTDRVLSLLLDGSEPSRVLCLTFTRAAAAEMANRLNERLALWATADDGSLAQELGALLQRMPSTDDIVTARRLFARVLDAPGGMKIETIHAFCQSLLRRFPLEAGIAPHFEVMDERNAAEALAAARDTMLAEARLGGNAELADALDEVSGRAAETTFDDLTQALVLDRARLDRALGAGVAPFRARLAAAIGIAADATPERVVAAACADLDRRLADAARRMSASGSARDRGRGAAIARFLDAPPGERPALFDEYCGVFLTQGRERRKDVATKPLADTAPDLAEALRDEAGRLERACAARAAAALLKATMALATLGARTLALYRRHKEQRALLDYDDLVLAARDLLCRERVPSWVLFKLDGGIDHILIDEAQDTNPEQWEVVAKLAEEFFAGAAARRAGRTIFAVGDAKQSIFSFQRAEPAKFGEMRRHFEGKVTDARETFRAVELNVSFRSTAAVLAAVDATFARSDARDGVTFEPGEAIRHVAFREGHGGLVELWPEVEPLAEDPPDAWAPPVEQRRASEPQLRLAAAIAQTIKGWIDRREMLPSRDRRITAGDIMVLVRRRTAFVTALVRALKARGIAVAGSDRMKLVEQLAVEDLMALLQALLLPEDDLTLATVLKGPLFDFGEELLFDLAHERAAGAGLWSELRRRAGERPEFAAAAARLGELLARADYAPPYELLAEILGERGGRRRWLARLGPEAEDPLDELLAAALAYERRHGPSLQGFLHWLGAGEIEVKRDFDQRGRDEIRIMTVHGAKGLQAPIVFLPDTLQLPRPTHQLYWTEAELPLWAQKDCGGAALDRARDRAKELRLAEYRRLLYVAMTRAEDRLYVCGWRTKQDPPQGTWHELVAAGLGGVAEVERFEFAVPGTDGWSGTGLRLVTPQVAPPKNDDKTGVTVRAERSLPGWARQLPAPEPIPPRPLAPSRPAGDEPAPRSPLGGDAGAGFRRGLLVHRLLQSLPQLPAERRAAAARRFLARPVHALTPDEQAAIADETLAVLTQPDFAAIFGPGSLAEVPVVALVAGRAISGRIDRLVVGADAVLIVDYKTLRPVPAGEDAIPPLYIEQLRAYRAAVAAIYPGRTVRCALLWTDGPTLMAVSERRLAIDAPDTHF